ncbi:hypothetical protein ACQKCH_14735 [Nubsella zeaxanthinifaciens]|uniref:hypothetical protein n=1 Tax=Nubsella zeaxanthinifaciens TaxID=392412 RepID=UPI003D042315
MAKRTKRVFNDTDKKEFLNDLKKFREACINVCIKAPINSDAYKLANNFVEQIIIAGENLTGNDKHFFNNR